MEFPFECSEPDICTDALDDFYIRVKALINYFGRILVLTFSAENNLPTKMTLDLTGRIEDEKIKLPRIEIDMSRWSGYETDFINQLYATSFVQLASHYELYLSELLFEIYYRNNELLSDSDRSFSAREIFEIGDVKEIKGILIDELVNSIIGKSYPQIVKTFENKLHVGIHSKKSPLRLVDVHHFFELRNILVHNAGHATPKYFERMSQYNLSSPPLLKWTYDYPDADFSWLFEFAKKLLELGNFIDLQIENRGWKTSMTKE